MGRYLSTNFVSYLGEKRLKVYSKIRYLLPINDLINVLILKLNHSSQKIQCEIKVSFRGLTGPC